MNRLAGKVAIITGGGSGLGLKTWNSSNYNGFSTITILNAKRGGKQKYMEYKYNDGYNQVDDFSADDLLLCFFILNLPHCS